MTFKLFGGDTVECRACHELVSTDATECPNCGENLKDFKLFGGSTVKCRACHEEVSTDAKECPNCGENLEDFKLIGGNTVKCRACHEDVSTDALECPNCGENLRDFKLFGGNTVECRVCHEIVSTDATECPNCGENLKEFKLFGGSTVKCRACDRRISTDATECPHCGEDLDNSLFSLTSPKSPSRPNHNRQDNQRQYEDTRYRPSHSDNETDSSGWLIKWAFYIALFIGAVWLALAVALPLIIINCAVISFIIGLTFNSDNKKYMFLLSLLGGIYIIIDYNKGLLTKTLVQNVSFFEKTIPFFLYLNIAAGLIASYFLIRNFINERNAPLGSEGEFSQRNLIIIGSLIVVGTTTVLLQRHFDSQRGLVDYNYNNAQTFVTPTVSTPNNGSTVAVQANSPAVKGDTTAKMTSDASINNSDSFYRNGQFTGGYFTIRVPSDFTARPSLKATNTGGFGVNSSAFFQSPDKQVEFYIFSDGVNDQASDIAINPAIEKETSRKVEKEGNKKVITWTEIKATDNSYLKAYQETVDPVHNVHIVVGLKYNSQASYNRYKSVYLAFKKSYTELGGD